MDFSLDPEQRAVQEAFGRFFQQESTVERVRAAEPLGYDAELSKQLWALGGASMGVPASLGGGGGGLLQVALVCEELGRTLAPVPLVEVAVTCRLLGELTDMDHLPGAMDGAPLVTLALGPAEGGRARLVPAGAVADVVIGLDGDELVAVESPAVRPRAAATLGSAPLADRDLAGDGAGPRRVLARGADATDAHRRARREWQVLTAAALVGIGAGALDLGVAYVKQRRQFGVPIGAFQAVGHRLADAATALDGARLLVYEAAGAADEGTPRAATLADMAFGFAAETAQRVAAESLHFHGGYGFMVEYDIQLYFRRAKAWALVGGDPRRYYQQVAAQLGGTAEVTNGVRSSRRG